MHRAEEIGELVSTLSIAEVTDKFPIAVDFFENYNLPKIDYALPLDIALSEIDRGWLEEFGLTENEIFSSLIKFLTEMLETDTTGEIKSLTIVGGTNKAGERENCEILLEPGAVYSIVGPTGSGKSRLLADIECLAQGDTPTNRYIKINSRDVGEEERAKLEGRIVAQLSQNMNFVMDLTVREFLEMHARSRVNAAGGAVSLCFKAANELAGEKFTENAKVTELSGGQSRALMIADCAYISRSPIVLIDEIENAGVDRRRAVSLLSGSAKIVLISTHDPLLALEAGKRIIIKNGGIYRILETDEHEKQVMEELLMMDARLMEARNTLRMGDRL